MEPIEFEKVNKTYAKDQQQYRPLPVYKTKDGILTSCWKLSFKERLKLLFTGKLWISTMTFNKPLQPLLPSTEFIDHEKYGLGENNNE
jgi:hypothetical protein